MVEGLSKRITGDWMEMSQAGLKPDALADYFDFSYDIIEAMARELTAAVEHGVVEYKEKILHPFFSALEDMKYKSVGFDELGRQRTEIGKVLLVTMIERLYAAGSLGTAGGGDKAERTAPQEDLKVILADVMARIREEPVLKTNKAVKMILTQLAIYQRERETMEKLMPNIRDPEKAASFKRNFGNTFRSIERNIGKYYTEFISEERKKHSLKERLDLTALPWKNLVPLLTKESRGFLRLRSTLDFALEGKYKVREICVHMYNEKKAFFALLEEETSAIKQLAAGAAKAPQIHAAFAAETVAALERLARRGIVEPGSDVS